VKRARVAVAIRRAGAKVEGLPDAPPDAPGEGGPPLAPTEPLLDFDSTRVYVRCEVNGAPARATVEGGALRLPAGQAGDQVLLRLEIVPDQAVAGQTVAIRARTEAGPAALRVLILDSWDEMGSRFARSRWPAEGAAAPIGPAWCEVRAPLDEFRNVVPGRPIRTNLDRVRCILLAVEAPAGKPIPSVLVDRVDLLRAPPAGGKSSTTGVPGITLADFDAPLEETIVLYDGTCVPFARTLATDADIQGFSVPGTTLCTPGILGKDFDPAMTVDGSGGSLRLHHGEGGAGVSSSATVQFVPEKDLARGSRALVFHARGAAGGERLRVRVVDGTEKSLGSRMPEGRWPAALFPRTAAADGAITLAREWRRYRIPRDAYPDVDFGAVSSLLFEFGEDVGSPAGATIFLDGIGLER